MLRKKKVLLLMSISVFLAIVLITVIVRGSLTIYDGIPTTITNKGILDNEGLNENEKIIISFLANDMKQQYNHQDVINRNQSIYVKYLEKYFSSPDINLSEDKAIEMLDLLKRIKKIMDLEQESDFRKMSLDGRVIATNISKKVYQLCDLTIIYNLEGDIVQITGKSGDFSYINNEAVVDGEFNYCILAVFLISWSFLFIVCICITMKYRLLLLRRTIRK